MRGYYGEFGDLAQRMAEYSKEHDLIIKGPVYTIYLLDEISIAEKTQYLSQTSVAVSNRVEDK